VSRLAYIGPAILIVYALLRSIDVVEHAYLMDPHYFWLGARILAQGGDPYDAATWDGAVRASFAQFGAALPPPWPAEFRYPLWTAIAVLPLAALPLQAAVALWQLLLGSVSAFATLFRHALLALGDAAPHSKREAIQILATRIPFEPSAFLQLLDIRDHKTDRTQLDAKDVFTRYLAAVQHVTAAVDRMLDNDK